MQTVGSNRTPWLLLLSWSSHDALCILYITNVHVSARSVIVQKVIDFLVTKATTFRLYNDVPTRNMGISDTWNKQRIMGQMGRRCEPLGMVGIDGLHPETVDRISDGDRLIANL